MREMRVFRAALAGWYPYPFLDAAAIGYAAAAGYLALVGNALGRRVKPAGGTRRSHIAGRPRVGARRSRGAEWKCRPRA